MKNISITTSIAAVIVTSVLAYPALAETRDEAKAPVAAGASNATGQNDKNMRQFSEAGHSAMTNIADARLAIFNGDTGSAMKLMQSAKSFLTQADKDATFMGSKATVGKADTEAKNSQKPTMRSVPIDGQLTLADDFVMTPEKKVHVDKANESFKKGDHAKGLEELRLGAIDVNYSRWWLPLAPSVAHLDQAMKLANESKYYEANLALKAIEDSVTIDSISFSDLPTNAKVKGAS